MWPPQSTLCFWSRDVLLVILVQIAFNFVAVWGRPFPVSLMSKGNNVLFTTMYLFNSYCHLLPFRLTFYKPYNQFIEYNTTVYQIAKMYVIIIQQYVS